MLSPSADLEELASTLVKARAMLGITQNELHKRTGISREAIKGYESGRNKPGARELKLLCDALQVSPNFVLYGTESPFEAKGDLYDFMHLSGQLDWTKFLVLFNMLTVKEKTSIVFIIESILLGRHSQEEITKRIGAVEAISAMMNSMVQGASAVKEGKIKSDELPNHLAGELDKFLSERAIDLNKKKPG